MARWLNWLERPVHTREVASSSLALAITSEFYSEVFLSQKKYDRGIRLC